MLYVEHAARCRRVGWLAFGWGLVVGMGIVIFLR